MEVEGMEGEIVEVEQEEVEVVGEQIQIALRGSSGVKVVDYLEEGQVDVEME